MISFHDCHDHSLNSSSYDGGNSYQQLQSLLAIVKINTELKRRCQELHIYTSAAFILDMLQHIYNIIISLEKLLYMSLR